MSQLEETDDFYATGKKLAQHIADSNDRNISTATLQALIRDLLPQHEEMQEALRSIATRPDFLRLAKLEGNGNGLAKKCAFIESLKKIYSAETIHAADRLVCGMMGFGVTTSQNESEAETIVANTLTHESKANDLQVATQGEDSYEENSPVQPKSGELAKSLSPVSSSHSMRKLALILVAAFAAVGIGEVIRVDLTWRICRAVQYIRAPITDFYWENEKPLKNGQARFAPPDPATNKAKVWEIFNCRTIPGIYMW